YILLSFLIEYDVTDVILCHFSVLFFFFFFFQAEDGIRDGHVTGVQTCALPISQMSTSAGFSFPTADVDIWVTRPSEWSALPSGAWRTVGLLKGFARLKPQVSFEQARAEMNVLQRRYATAHPNPNDADPRVTMNVVPLRNQIVANVRPMLWMLV